MIFYIFGTSNIVERTSASKAIFTTEDIDIAVERFNVINLNHKYEHCYLVCDFEIRKGAKFFPDRLTDGEPYLPFLIIGEYHSKYNIDSPMETIRDDTIIIESDGFRHQFNNNYKAVVQFCRNLNNQITSRMFMKYIYVNDKNLKCLNEANIVSTYDIMDSMDKRCGIDKIILDEVYWDNANTKKEIKKDKNGEIVSIRTIRPEDQPELLAND